MKKIIISAILFYLLVATIVYAHPGRTDLNGGHYDRSTGIYHSHNGGTYYKSNKEPSNNEKQNVTFEELLEESRKETIFEDYKRLSANFDEKSKEVSNLKENIVELIAEHKSVIKRLLICFFTILILCMFVCYNLGILYSKNKYSTNK